MNFDPPPANPWKDGKDCHLRQFQETCDHLRDYVVPGSEASAVMADETLVGFDGHHDLGHLMRSIVDC